MSLTYRKRDTEVDVDRFIPNVKPWPEGVEQYTREKTESLEGDKNEWFGWRCMTPNGWEEVKPLDYILTDKEGGRWVYTQEELFAAYEMV